MAINTFIKKEERPQLQIGLYTSKKQKKNKLSSNRTYEMIDIGAEINQIEKRKRKLWVFWKDQ